MSEIEHAAIDAAKEVMDSDQLLTELCIYAATNDLRQLAVEQQIKSQLAQLTRERDAALDALEDLLIESSPPERISSTTVEKYERACDKARAALATGNGRRSPSCDEREKMLRASLLSFVRVENSFGHTGQHKPNECADCKRVIQANEALGHGFLLSESALAMGKEKRG